ncbi:MAG: DUF3124 domain-containing protein [Putridiphycobacter sp.]|nr:DUF3124 domain-containing protein [Putridiphycobacter sp.]
MRKFLIMVLGILFLGSCGNNKTVEDTLNFDWQSREVKGISMANLIQGKTYLPVYSHIYHRYDNSTFDLTITVSIRNTSVSDSVYITKADYYNTGGEFIRHYAKKPVYLAPMETIEIVIAEYDTEGGSGANFIFEWAADSATSAPLFEAVMISTNGQQGLSFSTRGVSID